MTPRSHHHICGYGICIIPKYMNIDLNRFRIKLVSDLQYKYVGIHICKSAYITRLVTDNTVHKGTSKLHKTDKNTHSAVHVSSSVFIFLKKKTPTTPNTLSKMQWTNVVILILMSMEKHASPFCQICLV